MSKLTDSFVARRSLFDNTLQFVQHSRIERSEVEARLPLHMLLQRRTQLDKQFGKVIDRHEVKRMLATRYLHRSEELSLALGIQLSTVRVEMSVVVLHDRKLTSTGK
ncbi:hypothetical protein ABB28_01565 [Stenotrophomonas chelatiphaga]|uniref:Uncharacterized protein n=1 Tax=Stenotrophomonas chelatiphaga TaxID=517011 RepID=A0A0R0DEI2_9GAMM|nr:hypothetical protein ABB28_01565 [Stenotrophomonas chelatiphaga]